VPSDSLHFPGHSKLIQKIIEEISLRGPLTFARFMEMALYDEHYGYYMTPMVGDEASSQERIGWEGDFYTAPELSPILAETLVRQVLEIDAQLGHPDPEPPTLPFGGAESFSQVPAGEQPERCDGNLGG